MMKRLILLTALLGFLMPGPLAALDNDSDSALFLLMPGNAFTAAMGEATTAIADTNCESVNPALMIEKNTSFGEVSYLR